MVETPEIVPEPTAPSTEAPSDRNLAAFLVAAQALKVLPSGEITASTKAATEGGSL